MSIGVVINSAFVFFKIRKSLFSSEIVNLYVVWYFFETPPVLFTIVKAVNPYVYDIPEDVDIQFNYTSPFVKTLFDDDVCENREITKKTERFLALPSGWRLAIRMLQF